MSREHELKKVTAVVETFRVEDHIDWTVTRIDYPHKNSAVIAQGSVPGHDVLSRFVATRDAFKKREELGFTYQQGLPKKDPPTKGIRKK